MPIGTLAVAKRLIEAGVPRQQAEVQAEIWADIVESDLATKRDLKEVEVRLSRDIKEIEAKLSRDIKELDTRLSRDIKELELKMDKGQIETQRHMLQVGLGMAALTITVLGFLFRFLGK